MVGCLQGKTLAPSHLKVNNTLTAPTKFRGRHEIICNILEATPGIEPGYAVLQTAASPLRHVALGCGLYQIAIRSNNRLTRIPRGTTTSRSRNRRRPAMALSLRTQRPSVERIVNDHSCAQHFLVVGVDLGKAQRHGKQAWRFRREVQCRRVRTSDDSSQMRKCGVGFQCELFEEGVKTATLAAVREADTGNIERFGANLS